MKMIITNTFHNTSINLRIKGSRLSEGQVKRAEKKLCDMNCACGSVWSERHTDLGVDYENAHLEPIYDHYNRIIGADIVEN